MTRELTDQLFAAEVEKSSGLVLVDFWANWCGPCKQIAPILDAVSEEMSEKVSVFKMDIDKNTETPTRFGVRSIPTLMLFKDGVLVATKVGLSQKKDLISWIESAI